MSLVPDYDDSSNSSSSSSDEESDVEAPEEAHSKTQLPKPKFPAPDFLGGSEGCDEVPKGLVFKNPFAEAENAKAAILQKHVKMVDSKDNTMTINGKKICWNYRKGRCRFGHNCKFAHDSDIQKSKEQLESERQVQTGSGIVCQSQDFPQPTSQDIEQIKAEPLGQKQQKRKRPGLTQGLVPGKKVMKNYHNLKS